MPALRSLLALLLLLVPALLASAAAPAPTVDAARDPRLARRLLLRAEAIPLSRVLQRLSERTGVQLSVAGKTGDERLVAFVPDGTLSDVMEAVADLYRLRWARGAGASPAYRLIKPPATEREEAELRERCFRGMLDRLAARTRGAAPTEPEERSPEREAWLRSLPDVLPLIAANQELLLSEGYVYIPIARLPVGTQERLAGRLQPELDRHHEQSILVQKELNEERRQKGEPPIGIGGADGPAPLLRESTIIAEIRLEEQPQVWLGLRDRYNTQYSFARFSGEDLQEAGLRLYTGRRLAPPAPDNGALEDPLRRLARVPSAPGGAFESWIGRLGRLSDAAGVPIYADCYPNFLNGMDDHPRGDWTLPAEASVARELDRLCRPVDAEGKPQAPHSFWWAGASGALIRSRRWLWEEETVLPADLLDRLAASMRRSRRLEPDDLAALARLNGLQVLATGYLQGNLDAWAWAVRVPARLTARCRELVLQKGLEWSALSPEEQVLLLQVMPPPGPGAPEYRASLKASVETALSQGGSVLQTEVEASWTGQKASGALHLPLPGIARGPGLRAQGLVVLAGRRPAPPRPPRLVGALYYPIYGTPTVSGAYRGMERVAPVERRIGNFAHYPARGPYDSTDVELMKQHLAQLKDAGIDLLVVSWAGPGSFEDSALRRLLPLAAGEGLRVSILVEPGAVPKPNAFVPVVSGALRSLAAEPAYLKLDGRPVLFLADSLRQQIDVQAWTELLRSLDSQVPPGVIAASTGGHAADALAFDGLQPPYTFPLDAWGERHTGPEALLENQLGTAAFCRARGKIAVATVAPGSQRPRAAPTVDRREGQTYRETWEAALRAGPDWVLISSFNHWPSGTEIEPSVELGDRYLRLTADYAARFKSAPR